MPTKMTDGVFSAVLLVTAGGFAAPSAYLELDLATDTIKVPWGHEWTESQARRARDTPMYIEGKGNYAGAVDVTVDDDQDDAAMIVLKAAAEASPKTIVPVIFCVRKANYDSATAGPHADYDYIKGEYLINITDIENGPGKPVGRTVQFRRGPDCKRAVMVEAV